jgi:hypothetical protein
MRDSQVLQRKARERESGDWRSQETSLEISSLALIGWANGKRDSQTAELPCTQKLVV